MHLVKGYKIADRLYQPPGDVSAKRPLSVRWPSGLLVLVTHRPPISFEIPDQHRKAPHHTFPKTPPATFCQLSIIIQTPQLLHPPLNKPPQRPETTRKLIAGNRLQIFAHISTKWLLRLRQIYHSLREFRSSSRLYSVRGHFLVPRSVVQVLSPLSAPRNSLKIMIIMAKVMDSANKCLS